MKPIIRKIHTISWEILECTSNGQNAGVKIPQCNAILPTTTTWKTVADSDQGSFGIMSITLHISVCLSFHPALRNKSFKISISFGHIMYVDGYHGYTPPTGKKGLRKLWVMCSKIYTLLFIYTKKYLDDRIHVVNYVVHRMWFRRQRSDLSEILPCLSTQCMLG